METWEKKHSHENIFDESLDSSVSPFGNNFNKIKFINQFSDDFLKDSYDVYEYFNNGTIKYKSLLEFIKPCSNISGGGEARVLMSKLINNNEYGKLIQLLYADSDYVVLLYKEGKFQYTSDNIMESKVNGISTFMFPGYCNFLGTFNAPQPCIGPTIMKTQKVPYGYQLLLNEGKETTNDNWTDLFSKNTLQWFQTIVFRFYIYNCSVVRQEDKYRNWTTYIPKPRDIYVFILKLPTKCVTYSCAVEEGTQFIKAIDIDEYIKDSSVVKHNTMTGKDSKTLLQNYKDILPLSYTIFEKSRGDLDAEQLYGGIEEIFIKASQEGTKPNLSNAKTAKTYVIDASMFFTGKQTKDFRSYFSFDNDLELIDTYKSFLQILMILNDYTGIINWKEPEFKIFIDKLPDDIKNDVKSELYKTTDFTSENISVFYSNIKDKLPSDIKKYIDECVGTRFFSSKGALRIKKTKKKSKKGPKRGRRGRRGKKDNKKKDKSRMKKRDKKTKGKNKSNVS